MTKEEKEKKKTEQKIKVMKETQRVISYSGLPEIHLHGCRLFRVEEWYFYGGGEELVTVLATKIVLCKTMGEKTV